MVTECASTSTKYGWRQVHQAEDDLATLRRLGIEETHPAYQRVWEQREAALATIGYKVPKPVTAITHVEVLSRLHALGLVYAGASPGFTIEELKDAVVTIWRDAEEGWMSEARFKTKGKPIYRSLTLEEAVAFIKGEESGELIAKVFMEEEYYGE